MANLLGESCPLAAREAPTPICFTNVCNMHDTCYGTCIDNNPFHKNQCDIEFIGNAQFVCQQVAFPQGLFDDCMKCARAYQKFFLLFGDRFYEDAQDESRLCCP